MNFDEAVEIALRTWYPEDHPLHLNPHHPLGKLAGEWGELLDDYMKLVYKPDFQLDMNELGDLWYYLRILAYQENFEFHHTKVVIYPEINLKLYLAKADPDLIMATMAYDASREFIKLLMKGWKVKEFFINTQFSAIVELLKRQDLTINDLTASNWQKLKPGSERGKQWMKARESTEYVGGKIAKGDLLSK